MICSLLTTTCWRRRKTSSKIVPGRVNPYEQNGWAIRVSVKSVNHRFLDVRFRLPEGFDVYELRLRQIVRERIHRGHIDVNVNVQPGAAVPVQVNRDLLQAYAHSAEELRRQLGSDAGLDEIGRATSELQSRLHLVCRRLL